MSPKRKILLVGDSRGGGDDPQRRHKLVAKVFGGSMMSSALAATGRDLGSQNVTIATQELALLGIPVMAADTGGAIGRKLIFQTDDGTAWVKFVERR